LVSTVWCITEEQKHARHFVSHQDVMLTIKFSFQEGQIFQTQLFQDQARIIFRGVLVMTEENFLWSLNSYPETLQNWRGRKMYQDQDFILIDFRLINKASILFQPICKNINEKIIIKELKSCEFQPFIAF
jgi:hypothetical protein